MALDGGITPVMNVNPTYGETYGGFGGCWVWIILLFFLMNGNGYWGNRGDYATQAQVYASNDQQSLMGAIGQVRDGNIALGNGLADATFALNNNLQYGFTNMMRDHFGIQRDIYSTGNNLQRQVADVGYQAQIGGLKNTNMLGQAINQNRFDAAAGMCAINHNVDNVKYDAALNTNKITANATENTQKILDKICQMEMNAKDAEIASLRQQLGAATLAYSQNVQTDKIKQAMHPMFLPNNLFGSPCPMAA